MREIRSEDITAAVEKLCVEANIFLNSDIRQALAKCREKESSALGKQVLNVLLENADMAAKTGMPICQDTGMTVVFALLGQDAHVTGGWIEDAIQEGVRRAYVDGYLRKSVVGEIPSAALIRRIIPPAVIHYSVTPGDHLQLIVAPKGFGSENMSRVKMLTPADGLDGVKKFVLDTVFSAGANPCPPIIVGVGVGGTMEKAALLAKAALLRSVGENNSSAFWAETEADLLRRINAAGGGPAGFGGDTTALAVHISIFPTHIAGLPVAVNIGCHVTRHAEAML
jgi:fumarate hydratase subunit alpha